MTNEILKAAEKELEKMIAAAPKAPYARNTAVYEATLQQVAEEIERKAVAAECRAITESANKASYEWLVKEFGLKKYGADGRVYISKKLLAKLIGLKKSSLLADVWFNGTNFDAVPASSKDAAADTVKAFSAWLKARNSLYA